MSVQSTLWIAWSATAVLGYWLVRDRWRDAFLVTMTLTFLCVCSPWSAAILMSFSWATFMTTSRGDVSGRSVTVLALIVVAALIAFKVAAGPIDFESATGFIVPLGVSYYALRCLHYAIERYKHNIAKQSLRDFLAYQFFLPTLLAGPIHRFPSFQRDRQRRRWDVNLFSRGLERILFGYVKIVVLGNYVVSDVIATRISSRIMFEEGVLCASTDAWQPLFVYLDLVTYGVNLYLQFSGYSDVAIGFAMLLGFRVMENFDWPFLRRNVSEFWKSWHVSLTSWCREYIYMVAISKWRSPTLASVLTMVAVGCWHEVSVRYLVWGIYHGLGIAVWQRFQRVKPHLRPLMDWCPRRVLSGLSLVLTLHFIVFGFSIVQGSDLSMAMQKWRILIPVW